MGKTATDNPKSSNNTLVYILLGMVILILLLVGAYLGYAFFENQKIIKNQQETIQQVNLEKDSLSKAVKDKITKIDSIDNVVVQLEKAKLIAEEQAKKYLEELERLRRKLYASKSSMDNQESREFSIRLTKLTNQLNKYKQLLAEENKKNAKLEKALVESAVSLKSTRNTNVVLSQKNSNLKSKLNEAAVLSASLIKFYGVKKRKRGDKTEDKAKKVDAFKVELIIAANPLLKEEIKDLYIVINDTKNKLFAYGSDKTFNYRNSKIKYTKHIDFKYNGTSQRISTEIDVKEKLAEGQYKVIIYTKIKNLGSQILELD